MPDNKDNPFIIPPETIDEERLQSRTFLERLNFPRRWLVAFIVAIIALLALLVWTFFLRNTQNIQPDVSLWFDTSETITSGSASALSLVYENRDNRDLENASLEIVYPDGFRFIESTPASQDGTGREFSLGEVLAGGTGSIKITGIFNGSPQETQVLRAKLYFRQKGISAQFSRSADSALSLQAPDFNLRVSAPVQVVSEQKIDYALSFQNVSDTDLDRVQIRLIYPSGFKFTASDRGSPDNAVWEIGAMKIGQEAKLNVFGTLSGRVSEIKTLQADVGYIAGGGEFVLQSRTFASTRIAPSPLSVTSEVETLENIAEGGNVRYKIVYKNIGEVGMNNVKIVMHLDENAVDYSSLLAEGGALVGKDVIWNPAGVPALRLLQPQTSGTLSLSLAAKSNLSSSGVINPAIHTRIVISSNELPEPVEGGEITVKVKTKLALALSYEYVSGASPLAVGQETVYRIKFKLSNAVNQADGATWTAVLNTPTLDFLDGSVIPESSGGDFKYNAASGRITWNAGILAPFSSSEVSFLAKVLPSAADRLSGLSLVKSIEATARDEFSGEIITAAAAELSTGL